MKRESGESPEQYLLLYVPFLKEENCSLQDTTGVNREGARNGNESEDLP